MKAEGDVTVIWIPPRFGHPHIQNPDYMGIPFSYYFSDLGYGQGYRGCPYHQGFGYRDAQNAEMPISL